jgi:hypothetical protein
VVVTNFTLLDSVADNLQIYANRLDSGVVYEKIEQKNILDLVKKYRKVIETTKIVITEKQVAQPESKKLDEQKMWTIDRKVHQSEPIVKEEPKCRANFPLVVKKNPVQADKAPEVKKKV